jgi:hypothetical protein
MSAFSHQSDSIWRAAAAARDRAEAARSGPATPTFDGVIAVLLAAASAEAFINEIPERIDLYRRDESKELVDLVDRRFWALSDVLNELERGRVSILSKYLMAAQALGHPYDRAANPFRDFRTLITLRNDVLHIKPRNRYMPPNGGTVGGQWPDHVAALEQQGLVLTHSASEGVSWLEALETPELANWACETSLAIVASILHALPDAPRRENPLSDFGPLWEVLPHKVL